MVHVCHHKINQAFLILHVKHLKTWGGLCLRLSFMSLLSKLFFCNVILSDVW